MSEPTRVSTKVEQLALCNLREAARLLSISERTVWLLTKSGDLPCVRIGRALRYRPEDLQAFVEARLVNSIGENTNANATESARAATESPATGTAATAAATGSSGDPSIPSILPRDCGDAGGRAYCCGD